MAFGGGGRKGGPFLNLDRAARRRVFALLAVRMVAVVLSMLILYFLLAVGGFT